MAENTSTTETITTTETVGNTTTDTRTPVVFPLLNLLRSRKFIVALASLIASIIVSRVPELRPQIDMIIFAIVVVSSVLIGGISLEDALIHGRIDSVNAGDISTVGVELKDLLRISLEEKLLDSTKTEEEKAILRELLERIIRDIPEGQSILTIQRL